MHLLLIVASLQSLQLENNIDQGFGSTAFAAAERETAEVYVPVNCWLNGLFLLDSEDKVCPSLPGLKCPPALLVSDHAAFDDNL
jgi:hypothetical protein